MRGFYFIGTRVAELVKLYIQLMHILVQHEVEDFEVWKKVYDEDEPARAAAGIAAGRCPRRAIPSSRWSP